MMNIEIKSYALIIVLPVRYSRQQQQKILTAYSKLQQYIAIFKCM